MLGVENWSYFPTCWKTYRNCIAFELGTLGGFFCAVLFYFMCPLWWDNYKTTSEAQSPGLEAEMDTKIIKTETSLHLNLEVYFLFSIFHFVLFYFIYIYIFFFHLLIFLFLFISFYFQSSLRLSNAFSAYDWLVHCLSLFISLKLFSFVPLFCFFFFLLHYLFFPFPLTSLLSIPSHPSILNITSVIIIRQKILNCTQYRDNNNTKGNDGKTEKTGKPVSLQQKISTRTRGKLRKQILRSRLQQNEDKLCQRTQWSPQE
jgi:hypothetical protein